MLNHPYAEDGVVVTLATAVDVRDGQQPYVRMSNIGTGDSVTFTRDQWVRLCCWLRSNPPASF